MKGKSKVIIVVLLILALIIATFLAFRVMNDKGEVITVKSEKELLKYYEGDNDEDIIKKTLLLGGAPLFLPVMIYNQASSIVQGNQMMDYDMNTSDSAQIFGVSPNSISENSTNSSKTSSTESSSESPTSEKDYSKTNVQVENVDEADITKTDGDYIFSLSEDKVIITDVKNPEAISIASTIESQDGEIPEDLILSGDKLVVINLSGNDTTNRAVYNSNTTVNIYDISVRESPKLVKNFELRQPYYTSRCIDGQLYVISSGRYKEDDSSEKILHDYSENGAEKEIPLDKMKFIKEIETSYQTVIASIDVNNTEEDVDVSAYAIDVENAYVSEKAIYLTNEEYTSRFRDPEIKDLFGPLGIYGLFDVDRYETGNESGTKTEIYKFDINKDGEIKYNTKAKVEGETINQYSMDEKDGHLRIALYDNKGTRVAIFDNKMNKIGVSEDLAKGEKMYASRFIGNKVYLVTYQTVDPLFVIDLSNEFHPKVLGQLKIPGYSTYLHPYDENHIIGIGMQTQEKINRDSNGKVINKSASITGMKMALFDVSNVTSPEQISQTVIGDSRTTSVILTNPKALLFSKQKELIAIPVNNYQDDFNVDSGYSETTTSLISNYTNYSKPYISEGYLVYKINLEEGFKLKGSITHEAKDKAKEGSNYYYYGTKTRLLRGLYIDNNLYTMSETAIKVNNLDTLQPISEINIEEASKQETQKNS